MVFPWPAPDPEEQERIRALNAAAREIGARMDHREIEEKRWIGDRRDPRPRRGRALRPLRRRALRRPGPLADRLRARVRDLRPDRRDALDRPRRAPVDRLQGHPHVRHRGAEGALPPRPRRGPQARRLRAHRARGRLRRLRDQVARGPAARRLLGPQRREALHRQRLQGRGVHRLRPLRGRRQGPPHRPDPGEGDEGVRGRRALRHHGPARQRPAPAVLQRRPGARPRTSSASPATGFRIAMSGAQQRPHRPRHRLGRRDQAPARPGDRPRQGAAPVRPPAGRVRAGPGQDRLDGLLPVRARVRCAT